jgi:hypothetical protein
MKTHIIGTAVMSQANTQDYRVVSRDEWVAERKKLRFFADGAAKK